MITYKIKYKIDFYPELSPLVETERKCHFFCAVPIYLYEPQLWAVPRKPLWSSSCWHQSGRLQRVHLCQGEEQEKRWDFVLNLSF